MIDVDYFKKFNDTFGHKTGDQVLKMIASRLGKISGGAKTFRYGGEEFTAIFAGKAVEEAISHIEDFREAIGSTPFVVRDCKRRRKKKNDCRRKNSLYPQTSQGDRQHRLGFPGREEDRSGESDQGGG